MNIKEIALKAGVSIATVSRVVNNKPGVKDDVREHVEKIIQENDYRPNLIARGLVSKKSNVIGVMIPQVNSFYTGRIEGVFETLNKYGYSVMIATRIKSSSEELANFYMLYEKQVEGILYFASRVREEYIEEINKISKKIPIVIVDQEDEKLEIPSIVQDNYNGTVKMMEYLISKGYKKIAFIEGFERDKAVKFRTQAYKDVLKKNHLHINESYISGGDFSMNGGYDAAKKIMEKSDIKPEVIFAANDSMAIGAINYLTKNGYRVPEDIGVAGFDDIEAASYISPPLTTIRQDHKGTGIEAAELLVDYIRKGKFRTKKIVMNQELIERESTRK